MKIKRRSKKYEEKISYRLHAREKEIKGWIGYGNKYYVDYSESAHFTAVLPMQNLRHFLTNFGEYVAEIKAKMEERQIETDKIADKTADICPPLSTFVRRFVRHNLSSGWIK